MDRGPPCEIETPSSVHPTLGVPCPACNGVIYESCPNEDKKQERSESSAFRNGTYGEDRAAPRQIGPVRKKTRDMRMTGDIRYCREHELEDGEHEGGDAWG